VGFIFILYLQKFNNQNMKKIFLLSLTTVFLLSCSKEVEENKYESKVLLQAVTENTLGEKINFPDSNETITSAIRVIPSGESTGIHMHEAIPVVYMIDGEITINHETENGLVTTVVKKGESFVGATNNWHDTKVTSASDAVAYVVFIGAKDLKNSINKE
jgi:quercetin dioxygenase-like cupin family protein